MGSLDEMENYLDRYHKPKLNQDQVICLNFPLTPKEIKVVIKNHPTIKRKELGNFSTESYQAVKEELIPIFYSLNYATK